MQAIQQAKACKKLTNVSSNETYEYVCVYVNTYV